MVFEAYRGNSRWGLYLCIFVLNLVLVSPVEVKSMGIHVEGHRSHSRQILQRKTSGTIENTQGGMDHRSLISAHLREKELFNATPVCNEDSRINQSIWLVKTRKRCLLNRKCWVTGLLYVKYEFCSVFMICNNSPSCHSNTPRQFVIGCRCNQAVQLS